MRKTNKKCCGCRRRPVFSIHSMYCRTCAHVAYRMKERRFPPEAVEKVWKYIRIYGYRCYYTGMLLEMVDIKSPWFCVFDHLIPLDSRNIVLTSMLINEMKSALSEREFWNIVRLLADYIVKGKRIKRIKLAYWRHFVATYARSKKRARFKVSPFGAKPKWRGKHKRCCICGKPVFALRSKYCLSCSHFAHRLELKGFGHEAKQRIFDHVHSQGFVCQLTGIALDMVNSRSPWYGVFHYLIPGDPSTVVLTCALFAEMKSDLSIEEFWYYIKQLANYCRYGTSIRKKMPVYWYRLTPGELYLKSLRD